MQHFRVAVSALGAFVWLVSPSSSAFAFTPPVAPVVELGSYEEVSAHFARQGFSGVAIVTEGDRVLLEASHGFADVRTGNPMPLQAQFAIGSVTKQFASASILKLKEEGKLGLDDRISTHLPDFPRGNDITIRHLLTHTSGLFNYTDLPNFMELSRTPLDGLDFLIGLFKDLPLDFEPGTAWNYSNSGYVLTGAIIERLSGLTFGRFVRERLLDPLGMADTAYTGFYDPARKVEGHEMDRDYLPQRIDVEHLSWAHAAGGIYSTLRDLVRWNRGLEEHRILSQESVAEMEKPFLENYALALFISDFHGERAVWHTGGLPGFSSMNFRIPAKGLSVVTLSNFMNFTSSAYAQALAEIALLGKARVSGRPEIELTEAAAEAFAGLYSNEKHGMKAKVAREGSRLYFAIEGQTDLRLLAWGEDVFELKGIAFLKFRRDAEGRISGFTLTQNGQDFEFGATR